MGCWRNVPAEESQCSNTMNQCARLIPSLPRKKKKKIQSVSCSGLDWIKQRLLQGLIKFGGLFNKACLKICFLKLCPNTPCELPVPPFCPALSPMQLCNVAVKNCLCAVPTDINLDVRGPGQCCSSCPCSCLWTNPSENSLFYGGLILRIFLLLACLFVVVVNFCLFFFLPSNQNQSVSSPLWFRISWELVIVMCWS